MSFLFLDEKWPEFPLKWVLDSLPMPTAKYLFTSFKLGRDVSSFFLHKYKDNDFSAITALLSSPFLTPPDSHILRNRKEIVEQVAECYKFKLFAASICTALPLIEGILWAFSIELSHTGATVYNDTSNKIGRNKDTGEDITELTVGNLLRKTTLGNHFDRHFIEYFCQELYYERNPILHGDKTDINSDLNAARKIATIEYLLNEISEYIKSVLWKKLQSLPEEYVDKILMKFNSHDKQPSNDGS